MPYARNVEYFVYNTNTPLSRRTPPHHTRRNTKSIVSLYFYASSKSLFTMTNVPFSPFYTDLCLFICLLKELETEQAKSHWLHSGPSGYPNPTRYPVFHSIPDPTRFSFENHRVAGNPKYRVLPDISGKPEVSGITQYFGYSQTPISGATYISDVVFY